MNIKIGILTFHNVENYGGMLQAYALNRYINKIGYDCFTINYNSNELLKPYKLFNFDLSTHKNKRLIGINVKKLIILPFFIIRKLNFKRFMNNKIRLTPEIKSIKELKETSEGFDYIITGSDQVWNTDIVCKDKDIYLLNFIDSNRTKKVSFAASFGRGEISSDFAQELKYKLKDYHMISVREESAKNILNDILEKVIDVMIDPTLLLTKEEWHNISSNSLIKQKYIAVYLLEKNKKIVKLINDISKKKNLKVVCFDLISNYNSGIKSKYTSGPDEFVNIINNAEFVITNSFHGLAFSINLNKDFLVIPHSTKNTRIENLLQKTGLTCRLIKDNNYNLDELLNNKIDYSNVNEIILLERKKAYDFLKGLDK